MDAKHFVVEPYGEKWAVSANGYLISSYRTHERALAAALKSASDCSQNGFAADVVAHDTSGSRMVWTWRGEPADRLESLNAASLA
jgi:hypothetical protein